MAVSWFRQGKYKMNLDYLTVIESKEVLEKNKDGGMLKGHRSLLERVPDGQRWNKLSNK